MNSLHPKIPKLFGLGAVVLGLALSASTFAQRENLILKLRDSSASVETAAKLVSGYGKILKKEADGSYRVQVTGSAKGAASKLQSNAKVASARLAPPLRQKVNFSPAATSKDAVQPDFKDAYEYWYNERAFPDDKIDAEKKYEAIEQQRDMPGATIGQTGLGPSGTWQHIGPKGLDTPYQIYWGLPPVNGRVSALAFNCNATALYLGAPEGGVWKSTDGGINWTPLGDKWAQMQVSSIAAHPTDPNTMYVGTGDFDGSSPYGVGIMKTTNGGSTWTNIGKTQMQGWAVSDVVVYPETPNTVIAVTGRGANFWGHIWRSTDGGATWANVTPGTDVAIFSDLSVGIRPATGGNRAIYASGGYNPYGSLYVSLDQGATWTFRNTTPESPVYQPMLEVAASPTSASTVYMLGPVDRKVWKSTDYGVNWSDVTFAFPSGNASVGATYNWSQGFYDAHIHAVPAANGGDEIYVGLIDIVRGFSNTAGYGWQSIGGPTYAGGATTHNDQHCITHNPTNPRDLVFGNDGGAYRYNSNTNSSTRLNANLGITQFYHAGFHPTNSTIMIGGTQDNASPFANGNLAAWDNVGGGDGGYSHIKAANPAVQFTTSQFGAVYRTASSWSSASDITPIDGGQPYGLDKKPFIATAELDPSAGNQYFYTGTNYLWRYNDSTNTWTPRLGGKNFQVSANELVRSIGLSAQTNQVIYVGTTHGKLYRSANGGTSWTDITGALPTRSITSIWCSPTNANEVWVTLSGTGGGHAYRTTNAAAAPVSWINASGAGATGLPDSPANTVERDLHSNTTFYVGTDIGVFMTTNSGSTWSNATQPLGLPNVQVNKLKAVAGTSYLMAATFGRGMWRIRLASSQATTLTGLSLNSGGRVGGTGILTVVGGQAFTVNPQLSAAAGANTTIALADNSTLVTVPSSMVIPAGSSTAAANGTTAVVTAVTNTTVSAALGSTTLTRTLRLIPVPKLNTFSISPNNIVGGTSTTGYITLLSEAAPGNSNVTMTDNLTEILVSSAIPVTAGTTSATFTISSQAVTVSKTGTVTASLNGTTRSATLGLHPTPGLRSLTLGRTSVVGGGVVFGTVALGVAAPTGGARVTTWDNSTTAAVTPAYVDVPQGTTSRTFSVVSEPVAANVLVTVAARLVSETRTASFTVTPGSPSLFSVNITQTTLQGGTTGNGTVTISGVAPSGGTAVWLTDNSSAMTVSSYVVVPQGGTSVGFNVLTSSVRANTTVTLTARLGSSTRTDTVVLTP